VLEGGPAHPEYHDRVVNGDGTTDAAAS